MNHIPNRETEAVKSIGQNTSEAADSQVSTTHSINDDQNHTGSVISENLVDQIIEVFTKEIFDRRRSAYEKLAEGVK